MEDPEKIATDRITSEFETYVSRPRFKRYLRTHPDPLDAMSIYLWNMSLCTALYPAVQCLEITYRNALNDALRTWKGAYWFDDATLLRVQQQNKILAAKDELARQQRHPEPGRVVAELSFGFWTTLYSGSYTNTIVHNTLMFVFPHAPRRMRTPEVSQGVCQSWRCPPYSAPREE